VGRFGRNGSIARTSALSHVGCTSNAFKVTVTLQTFLFKMVVTSYISVHCLCKYGFAKTSNNLYASCILDLCRHLYSSYGSAKYWWMVGLPCVVSQCAKLHVAGWTFGVEVDDFYSVSP
jgi:hypothetical protein